MTKKGRGEKTVSPLLNTPLFCQANIKKFELKKSMYTVSHWTARGWFCKTELKPKKLAILYIRRSNWHLLQLEQKSELVTATFVSNSIANKLIKKNRGVNCCFLGTDKEINLDKVNLMPWPRLCAEALKAPLWPRWHEQQPSRNRYFLNTMPPWSPVGGKFNHSKIWHDTEAFHPFFRVTQLMFEKNTVGSA